MPHGMTRYIIKLCDIYISSSRQNGGTRVLSPNRNIESGGWGNSEVTGNISWDDGSKYPYVATSKSISTATAASNIGIPPLGDNKDVSTSTTTMQYYTTDQYGVRYEPTTYTFCGVTGLSTSGSIGNAYTATANESTTVSSSATYQTATVKLKWTNDKSTNSSQHGDSTYTFKVYNPRYKVTYSGNGGTLGTNYTYAYYNQKVSADSSTATSNNVAGLTAEKFPTQGSRVGYTFAGIWSAASGGTQYSADTKVTKNSTAYAHWTPIKYNAEFKGNRATYPNAVQEYLIANVATDFDSKPVAPTNVEEYDDGDYHYKFNGNWKNSSGNVYTASTLPIMTTAGATYKAQYNGTFVQADYSGVTAQENEAARIKSNPNYEAIYTSSSRNSLQAALDAVVTGKGRTQQDVVDGYAQRIKEAIDALEGQKYSVVFMDGRDNSIIKFSYPNVFGDTIQYPENPSMSYDKNYHYTFNKWEGTAQETNLSTVEKNITIVARFNKAAHNFTEEHIDSTCVKQGGTKYTCTTCGYSYTTYSGTYGDHVWSTEWTIDNPSTCTQPGSKSHHCTLCTATKDETVIPASGHDYTGVEPEVIVPVSCDTIGVSIRECTHCGYNDYITTDPIGHKMKDEVTAPTCTSKGYTTSTCEVCGKMLIGSFTDPIAHNYVKKDSECVAPSCVGVGYDVSYCSVCGLKKYDIISAKGHSWNEEQTVDIEPTCTTKGQKSIHCSVCDVISTDTIEEIPANGHSYDSGEVLAPATCTQDGVKAYHCTVAGCGHTKTETIAKLGHDWKAPQVDYAATCISAGQQSTYCSRCNEVKDVTTIPALGHQLTSTTTTATCTVGSKRTDKCSRCDYEKTTIISEALGHNFVAGTPVAATCASSGYTPYYCSRNCGVAGYNVINGGASKNHNWNIASTVSHGTTTVTGSCSVCGATFSETVNSAHDFKNIQSQTPATCVAEGSLVLVCADADCNETFTVTLEKNENAHKSVTNTLTKASCTEAGKVVSTCDDCKKVLATTEIPATGHSYTEQTGYVASTCQTKGHITFKCGNEGCDSTKTVELEVNPNAHKFENPIHYSATCKAPAHDKYTCAYGCGKTYESFTGTADTAAHDWKFSTSQTGTTLTIVCECAVCHTKHEQTVQVAEGHNYTVVKVTVQPTCIEEGRVTISCDKKHNENCNSAITVALPVNDNAHKIKTIVTPATCTAAGTAYSYCELCKKTIGGTVEIAELGHDYVGGEETVKTAATCEKDGVKTVKCTRCSDTIEIAIPKLGHTWDNGTIHEADCTHGAYTTYKCSTCNETKDVVSAGAKANGHDWNDWVIVNPTNDKAGSATHTCKKCGETETVEIPAGNHRFDATQYEEVKATCTKKGSRTYTCVAHLGDDDCGVSITVETDLAQHSYELKYNEKATCTTDGKVVMECSVCNNKNEVTIPAFGHTWDDGVVTKAATCTTEGVKTYTCSTCKETREEPIAKLPHEFVAGEEVLPTCKDGGKSGYIPYTCSCGETYNEITNKKIEHKWGGWETVQTANEERCGIEKRTCSECGAVDYEITDATGEHTYEDTIIKEATCTEEGSLTRRCTNPNHTDEKEQTLPIPALGHDMVAGTPVAATCEHEGYTDYNCSRCDHSYRIVTAAATGHSESDWKVVREATCTVNGIQKKTCTTCGEILKTEDIPATGHTEVTVNEEATCTEPGQSYTYCSVCKTITSEDIVIKPANGHAWGDWEVTKKSNNTEKGLLTRVCKTDETHVETVETPAGGHTFDMNNPSEEKKATCSEEGWKLFKCTAHTGDEACGIELKVTTEKVQHEFETVTESASCTESGSVKISCKNCDEAFEEIMLNPLGHDFTEEKENVASTCNSIGYITKQCSRCNETETTYSSTLADHSWGESKVVQTADETHPGIEVRQCSVCKLYEYDYTPPTGNHNWDEGVVTTPATCTTDGVKTYTCKADGNCACTADSKATYTEKIPATGHKAKVDVKEATCTETGYVKAVCENCRTVLDEKTLKQKAHAEKVTITDPTCTTPGSKVYTCAVCGATTRATEEIPVVPHAYETTGEYVDATCTSPKYEKYACKYCGTEQLVKVGEANGHKVDESKTVTVPATCTTAGSVSKYCSCGQLLEVEVINPKPHTWEKVTVDLEKECDGANVTYEKCSVCGVIKAGSLNITENGDHEYVVTTETPATCTAEGKLVITCSHCENIRTEVTIPAVGHTYDEGVLTEGTCEKDGNVTFTCTREGCTDAQTGHTITKNIGKKNHNYKPSGDPVAATCTSSGYQLYKCEYCSKEFKEILGAPAQHVYEKQDTSTEPNCYQGGHYVYKCKNCNASYGYDLPATGNHEFKSEVTQEQSCTNPEITTYTCTTDGCGYSYIEVTKSALGHSWGDWKVTKEPNEETGEDGEQVRSCTRSGCDATETASIPASIHNWGATPIATTDASCTEAATETYRCTGCDLCNETSGYKTYVKTIGVPNQHNVVVDYTAATCTNPGSYVARCTLCRTEFVNQTISATGHSFNTYLQNTYVPATCTEEGSVIYACSNSGCGETQVQKLDVNPDAHNMVEDPENSKKTTCTEAGYKAYKCANQGCDHKYMMQVENPVPHTAKDTWTVVKAATCSSDGYEVLECKDCGAIRETRTIAATGNHTWEKVTSDNAEPTCTEGSYSYNKCSVCGKLDETSFISKDALGHDFSEFVEKRDATAKESGYVIYKCSHDGCEEKITLVIPASGHDFTSKVTKEPTCTEKGERTYTCTVDGHEDSYTEEIPAFGHKAGDVEITPATCLAEGSAVLKCTVCNAELHNKTLAKLPHTFNDSHKTVVEADCQHNGNITYTCTTEGCTATLVTTLDKTPHDYKYVKSVAPTCLDSGYDVYACSVEGCTASYNFVTESANGHSYVENTERTVQPTCSTVGHKYFKCSACDAEGYDYEVPATGKHNYNETVKVDPTCEKAGYTYNKCTACDAVDKDTIKAIDPLGHDYSVDEDNGVVKCSRCDSRITVKKVITDEDGTHAFEGKITKQSTCKEQGTIEYTCRTHKNCAKNHTENLPLAEHSATADSIVKTNPVCKEDGSLTNGSIVVKCSVCGTQIGETVVIPAAHKYTVVKVERATCASKGKVTERCEACGHEKVTELEMNASAHEFESTPSIKVDATCITDGYEVYNCKHCDAQKFVKIGEKLNHQHTESVTKNATCTSEGYTRITCKDCGKIISETVIEKTAHVEMVVKVDATCTGQGSVTTKCSVCGKLLKDIEYTPALGHKWSDWKVISGGTCVVEGQRQRKCTACGEIETISTGIGEHVYPEKGVVTPPTCTTDGYTTYTCTVCHNHSIIKDYTPKLGHKYSSDYRIIIEPTCHSTGSKAHYCINCNAIEPEHNEAYVDIPRLPHKYGEWTVTVEPTCENTGIKERTCMNEGCKAKDEGHVETVVIGRLGHNYGDWEVTKESTCIEAGSQRRYCDRCQTWEIQTLPLGKHKRVADPEVAATCDKTGLTAGSHCEVCGKVFVEQKVIPKTNHMDLGGDGICDICGKTMTDKTGTDTCFCHGTGFRALVYSFVRLIWKLFKVKQYCVCGAKHW